MSLYLTILLCVIIIPLLFSFEKSVSFFKSWKYLIPSLLITGFIFSAVDVIFASKGIWGFNSQYHSNIMISGLPVEEILFFIIVPYASIFIHYVFLFYFPGVSLTDRMTKIITLVLIALLLLIAAIYHNRTYTAFYSIFMVALLLFGLSDKTRILNRFYLTYLIILIPFFIVNAILTGSFIEGEVIWYNNKEISGFRIFTIPGEDIIYGFSLIFMNLLLMSTFRKSIRTS